MKFLKALGCLIMVVMMLAALCMIAGIIAEQWQQENIRWQTPVPEWVFNRDRI